MDYTFRAYQLESINPFYDDRQNTVRNQLLDWYRKRYNPNLKLVAEALGINYWYIIQFKNGKVPLSAERLDKIKKFIEKN